MGMECLDDFFRGIQLCAEGRATAGFMRQSSPEAFRLPLNEALFDHKRYETGLKEVKSVLGADEDGRSQEKRETCIPLGLVVSAAVVDERIPVGRFGISACIAGSITGKLKHNELPASV